VHPVALLGRAIEWLDGQRLGHPRITGTLQALAVPLGCALLAHAAVAGTTRASAPFVAPLVAGAFLWLTSSVRLLVERAREVIEASDADLDAAREALPALVGRDPTALSAELARSAAVESLAENLSDGLIAPLLAFVVCSFVSLPAAAAGAAFIKAANTMDSMLGYPGPFGWASARLDDLLMIVPARLSALLLALAASDPDALRARRHVRRTASPNAGWPMGVIAAALNVRLEKPGVHVLNDVASLPTVADGRAAIRTTKRAAIGAHALAIAVGVIRWL
jgi:adenosylcobinamide-phosphate synthase